MEDSVALAVSTAGRSVVFAGIVVAMLATSVSTPNASEQATSIRLRP